MKKLSDDWIGIDKIVLYGWGNIGKKCFLKLKKDFTIVAIIENDPSKHGEFYDIPIIGANSALDIMKSNKIIVLTGGKVYKKIAESLIEIGLKEYIDFCSVEIFISEWYWEKRKENCLLEVHTAVTMRCTFNCKNCNMFVPYYHKKIDYSFDELKQMYDLFFKYVDYTFCITLLGGEPFISPILGEIIDYLGSKYSEKIVVINIISNGSIVPNDDLIEVIVRNKVLVYLSDYSATISYKSKFMQVVKKLQENNVEYDLRISDNWKNFGFPVDVPNINSRDMEEHMRSCAPIFHGLNDNKFYYCHVAWSAEKAGLYKLSDKDYVDLNSLDLKNKRNIIQHALGNMESKYVSLCKICGGCGDDNPDVVKAAVQMEKS